MKLLEAGQVIADDWVAIDDEAPLPDSAPAIISLARLQKEGASLAGRNAPLGVMVPPGTDPEILAPLLDRLALVQLPFPKFRDGRSFTIARTLRERYGYEGEIRATGHTLPDQYLFLLRCGVSTVEISDDADPTHWGEALGRYHIAHQAAVTGDEPLSLLRRRLSFGEARDPA